MLTFLKSHLSHIFNDCFFEMLCVKIDYLHMRKYESKIGNSACIQQF